MGEFNSNLFGCSAAKYFLRCHCHETQTFTEKLSRRQDFENLFRIFSLAGFAFDSRKVSPWIRRETMERRQIFDIERFNMRWWEAIVRSGIIHEWRRPRMYSTCCRLESIKSFAKLGLRSRVDGLSFRMDSPNTPHRRKAKMKFILRNKSAHQFLWLRPSQAWTQKIIYHQSQSHNSRIISYAPPTTVNRSQPSSTRHRGKKQKLNKIFKDFASFCRFFLTPVDTSESSIFIARTFDSWIAGFSCRLWFDFRSVKGKKMKKQTYHPKKWSLESFSANQVRAVNWQLIEKSERDRLQKEIHIGTSNTFYIKITSANKRAYDCKYARYVLPCKYESIPVLWKNIKGDYVR